MFNLNWTNVRHWAVGVLLFAIPLILTTWPKIGDVTVSAVLLFIYHALQPKQPNA